MRVLGVKICPFFLQKGIGIFESVLVVGISALLIGVSLYQYETRQKNSGIEALQRSVAKIEQATQRYTFYAMQSERAKATDTIDTTDTNAQCSTIAQVSLECLISRGLLKESDIQNPFGTGKPLDDFTVQYISAVPATSTQRGSVRIEVCTAVPSYKAKLSGLRKMLNASSITESTKCIPSGYQIPKLGTSFDTTAVDTSEKGWLVWELNPLNVKRKITGNVQAQTEDTTVNLKAASLLRELQESEGDIVAKQEKIGLSSLQASNVNSVVAPTVTASTSVSIKTTRGACSKGGSCSNNCRMIYNPGGTSPAVFECGISIAKKPWWSGCLRLRRGDKAIVSSCYSYSSTGYYFCENKEADYTAFPLRYGTTNITTYGDDRLLMTRHATLGWAVTPPGTTYGEYTLVGRPSTTTDSFSVYRTALNTYSSAYAGANAIPSTVKAKVFWFSRTIWVCEPACEMVGCTDPGQSCAYRCDKNTGFWLDKQNGATTDWQTMTAP